MSCKQCEELRETIASMTSRMKGIAFHRDQQRARADLAVESLRSASEQIRRLSAEVARLKEECATLKALDMPQEFTTQPAEHSVRKPLLRRLFGG